MFGENVKKETVSRLSSIHIYTLRSPTYNQWIYNFPFLLSGNRHSIQVSTIIFVNVIVWYEEGGKLFVLGLLKIKCDSSSIEWYNVLAGGSISVKIFWISCVRDTTTVDFLYYCIWTTFWGQSSLSIGITSLGLLLIPLWVLRKECISWLFLILIQS